MVVAALIAISTAVLMAASLAACSGGSVGSHRTDGDEITVSAAASLTDAFSELADEFMSTHPGVIVRTNFGSSAQLAEQVINGAPVDVVAFADERTMARLDEAGLVGTISTFALNSMVIVTKPDDTGRVESLEDLASPEIGVVALCRSDAPCGTYAERMLDSAGVVIDQSRITRGQDVRATLAMVTNGDADAAIVYRTDAIAAGERVRTIDLPERAEVSARYPIAVVVESSRGVDGDTMGTADAFVDHVLGEPGRAVLARYGFGVP